MVWLDIHALVDINEYTYNLYFKRITDREPKLYLLLSELSSQSQFLNI